LGGPEDTIPMLLFFSVARSAQNSQAERANEAEGQPEASDMDVLVEEGEKMPTDKLVDVSPLALRMSSPFNAGYWLAAA
jgi:predicted nucleotidyltransferase